MSKLISASCAVLVVALVLPLAAQRPARSAGAPPTTPTTSTPPATPSSNASSTANTTGSSNGTTNTANAGSQRQEPCWKVAGVSPSVLQQRRSIEQNTKSQIASVCADSSLTPQQRHQKIHEIHSQAQQQIQALITPQQQEALKACRAARGKGEEAAVHPAGGKGTGPCGEEPSSTPTTPATPNNPGSN